MIILALFTLGVQDPRSGLHIQLYHYTHTYLYIYLLVQAMSKLVLLTVPERRLRKKKSSNTLAGRTHGRFLFSTYVKKKKVNIIFFMTW